MKRLHDTPRTDAVLNTFTGKASKLAADLATHAEELERELTAATKERDEAKDAAEKAKAYKRVLKQTNAQLKRERDEWRNEHDRVVREYQHRLSTLATAALDASNYPEPETTNP